MHIFVYMYIYMMVLWQLMHHVYHLHDGTTCGKLYECHKAILVVTRRALR